ISETLTDPAQSTTAAGMLGAETGYMSPEQIEGRTMDRQSDAFSLGLLTFKMLTGRLPYSGRTPVEMLMARVTQRARTLSDVEPAITWGRVNAVVARVLETDRTKRYATAGDFARELTQAATSSAKPVLDENVQFTVYRPSEVRPNEWYPLLAFAHLAEAPDD